MDTSTAFIVVMLLSAVWVVPSLTRVMLMREAVRDDFGQLVPYQQDLLRRQTIELMTRLLLVVIVLAALANWHALIDHVNGWTNTQ